MLAQSQIARLYSSHLEPTELTKLNDKGSKVMGLLRAAESWNLMSNFGCRVLGREGCQQKVLPSKIVSTFQNQALCEKVDLG